MAFADENPATAPLSQVCSVVPSTTTGTGAGLPLVAQGETVALSQQVHFEAGQVYQDVFTRVDGSTYYASVVELDTSGASGISVDVTTATATLGGVSLPTTLGTEPSAAGFIIDTSTVGLIRLYFPGDVAAMIADPTGRGVPSVLIPTGGAAIVLAVAGVISATVPGTQITAGTCYASVSTGPSNRNTTVDPGRASLAGLEAAVTKTSDRETALAGSEVLYSVRVDVPTHDVDGLAVGSVYDVVVTDVLPAGLTPVAGSISDGGTFDAGTITWLIGTLVPGSTVHLTYRAIADGDAGDEITNSVSVSGSGLPGPVAGERAIGTDDDATITISGDKPIITKQADREAGPVGTIVTYTVEVVIPAGAPYYDVAIVDALPDGMIDPTPVGINCSGCDPGDPAIINMGPVLANTWELGWFLGDLVAAGERTYTVTYTAEIAETHLDGSLVVTGDPLTNLAEVIWNDIDALPGPAGLIDRSGWAGSLTATDVVTVGVPAVSIAKTVDNAAPLMAFPDNTQATWLTYRVTVTNTSAMDAYDIAVSDNLDTDTPRPLESGVVVTPPAGSVTDHAYSVVEPWIDWTYPGPLAPGASVQWIVRVAVQSGTSTTDPFTNTAEVTGLSDESGTEYEGPDPVTLDVNFGLPKLTPVKSVLSPASGVIAPGGIVTWQVAVTNTGDVTANRTQVCDSSDGTYLDYVTGSVSGTNISLSTLSLAPPCEVGFLITQPIAPGASYTFTYQTRIPATATVGTFTNEVRAAPYLFNAPVVNGYQGITVHGIDDSSVQVVKPTFTINKTPKASQNIPIIQGANSQYQILVTNTSSVEAVNMVVADQLPGQLSYPGGFSSAFTAGPILPSGPQSVTANVTTAAAGGTVVFTINRLAPGQAVTISLPVTHNGASPSDYPIQTNTATLTAPGVAAQSSEGVLYPQTQLSPPIVTKTVDESLVVVGSTVTFTADVAIPDNTDSMYDVTVVDIMADGFTPASPFTVTVTCLTGTCVTPEGDVEVGTPVQQPDGSWQFNAFIGDVPDSAGAFSYRFVYSAVLDEFFEGTGTPEAGALVLGGELGVPVLNTMIPRFNYVDTINALPPQSQAFTGRGFAGNAEVTPLAPNVHVTKSSTVTSIEVGEANTYRLDVTNLGTGNATNVLVTDDAAAGSLRNVVMDPANAVAPTDGWSLADPAIAWTIPTILPGQTVTLRYTATSVPSAELTSEAANYDAMRVRNLAAVTQFSGGGVDYSPLREDEAVVYIHTPRPDIVQSTSVENCPTVDQGETWTFSMNASNRATSTGLPTNIAPLYNVVIEEDLVAGLTYVPGSTQMSGVAALPAGFWEPTIISNPDGSTTLRWLIPEIAPNTINAVVITIKATVTDAAAAAETGGLAFVTLTGEDASGELSRGSEVGRDYEYLDDYPTGCVTPPAIEKEPTLRGGLLDSTNVPFVDPGETYVWDTTVLIRDAPLHGVVLSDILPAGVTYVSSTLTPSLPVTELVTPLGDGRTQVDLTYTGEFTANTTYVLDMTTDIDPLVEPNLELVNTITLAADEALFGEGCAPDQLCSSGTVKTRPEGEPTITKTVVGDASQLFGSIWTFDLEVTIPKDRTFNDLMVFDTINWNTYAAELGVNGQVPHLFPGATVTAACVLNCDTNPIVVTALAPNDNDNLQYLPSTSTNRNMAWVLESSTGSGVIPAAADDRVVQIRFTVNHNGTGFGGTNHVIPSGTGDAAAHYFTTDRAELAYTTNPNFVPNRQNSATAAAGFFNGNLVLADEAFATVEIYQPRPSIEKLCYDNVTNELASDPFDGGGTWDGDSVTPTPVGTPNVRCDITVSYNPPAQITDGLYQISVADWISGSSYYPTDGEFIGYGTPTPAGVTITADIPTVVAGGTGDAGTWAIDQLLPGESATVTMLYRLTATGTSTQFGEPLPSALGYVQNVAEVPSFAVTDGGPLLVATGIQDVVDLLLHAPLTDISKRIAPGDQPGLSSDEPAQAIVGEAVTYEVRVDIAQQGDQKSISLADTLPVGWEYVPGSATIKYPDPLTGSATDVSGPFSPQFASLFEPTIGASSGVCDAANNNAGGPELTWAFDRDVSGRDQLWDGSLLYDVPMQSFGLFQEYSDMARLRVDNSNFPQSQIWTADPVEWNWFSQFGSGDAGYNSYFGYGDAALPADKADWFWASSSLDPNYSIDLGYPLDDRYERALQPFFQTPVQSLYVQYQAQPTVDALDCLPDVTEPADFRNSAEVSFQRIDSDTPSVVSADLDTPVSGPLTIDKTPDGASVVDGTTATFTITVENHTGHALTNVVVRDDLSDVNAQGLTYVSGTFTATPATGVTETSLTAVPTGQIIEFTIASLPDEGSVVIQVPVPIPAGTEDQSLLDNLATALSTEYPDEPSDTGSVTVVNPAVAPDITKTMLSSGATPGLLTGAPSEPFTATATMVIPTGDSFIDMAATDTLPDGLRFVGYNSVTCNAGGNPCPAFSALPATQQYDSTTGQTRIGWWFGDLPGHTAERTFTFTYRVAIANSYADGTPVLDGDVLTNVITAVSNDTDKFSDQAPPTTPVDPTEFDYTSEDPGEASVLVNSPQLVLDKEASTLGPINPGDSVTFTVTVENVGTGTAYRVPVIDLPSTATASVVFGTNASLLVDGWTAADPDIRWLVPSIEPGVIETFTYTVTTREDAQALGVTELANNADVEPYRARPNRLPGDTLYDGVPPVSIHIPLTGSNVSVQKFAGDTCSGETVTFIPGNDVDFCVVISNNGGGTASNVTLTDTPASGFTYVTNSGTVQAGVASPVASEPTTATSADVTKLTWELGNLAPGAVVRVRYTLATDESVRGVQPNRARVTSTMSTGLVWPFNTVGTDANDDAAAVAVAASQEISKLPDMQTFTYDPVNGSVVEWQIIVTNPDAMPLTNLVVVDSLPVPFEYVSLEDNGLGGTVTTGTHSGGLGESVTWEWAGPLPAGQQRVLTLLAILPPGLDIDPVVNAGDLYQNEVSLASDQILIPVENTALAGLPEPPTPPTPTTAGLPDTGVDTVAPSLAALTLLLAGAGLMFARLRRRRSATR